jgi:hypothetical protein
MGDFVSRQGVPRPASIRPGSSKQAGNKVHYAPEGVLTKSLGELTTLNIGSARGTPAAFSGRSRPGSVDPLPLTILPTPRFLAPLPLRCLLSIRQRYPAALEFGFPVHQFRSLGSLAGFHVTP